MPPSLLRQVLGYALQAHGLDSWRVVRIGVLETAFAHVRPRGGSR
jgi:hypothetical protein